ncbi:MAG: hypothetical protein EBS69_04180, partial [Verrucomicrobia bacterium]|nr:hypothetical protein [Verrucomicrobiota bacterium]
MEDSPSIEAEKKEGPTLSLEELLKTEIPELAKENSATMQNWSLLIESLSKNEFKAADVQTETLLTSKSILAPLRYEFCVVYKEVSIPDQPFQKGESPVLVQIRNNNNL